MMKTKVIVITLLLFSVLAFSGCTKYVYLPCKAEEPQRTVVVDCEYDGNMTKLAKCAAKSKTALEGDYEVLLTRFRSCK